MPECTVFFPSSLLMRKALFDHLTARGIQVSVGADVFLTAALPPVTPGTAQGLGSEL